MRGERAISKKITGFYFVGNLLPFLLILISTKCRGSLVFRGANVTEDLETEGWNLQC